MFKENKDVTAIITDIEMPLLNGYDFTEEVRLLDKKIPIIAVSTRVGEQDREHGLNSGFTYHLEKLDKKEVLETLQKCLTN